MSKHLSSEIAAKNCLRDNEKKYSLNKLEQQIWKTNYVEPLFKKYESVPTKLKYMFIEKDYTKMFGKRMANDQMRYMYDDSETFIFAFQNALCEFSVRVRNNLMKKYWEELSLDEYYGLIKSGMFWEFFPNLSGDYLQDKTVFLNFIAERENKKEYFTLINSK